jgi:DNA-binding response OmpR family regulator
MSKSRVTTVLIVEKDLGLLLWCCHVLMKAGYVVLPAENVAAANGLLNNYRLESGLLIIDPSLGGAADLIETLRRGPANWEVVALCDRDGKTVLPQDVDAVVTRPGDGGRCPKATATFVLEVESLNRRLKGRRIQVV